MEFAKMLGRFKLASQFTLLLTLIFIAGIGLGGFALSKALEQKALGEMNARGQMAIQIVNSVRSYTSNDIAPLITQITDPQNEFIPETVPSIAAKRVFDNLKADWQYKDLIYKQATLNPTNLNDQADRFEAKLIERFESDRTLKSLSDLRSQAGEQLFYTAQPLVVNSSSCLKCHGSPEQAPKSHVERYGTQNGYGWKLNQIIGTQIIYIPASEVFGNARNALFLFISIFIGIFALVLVSINYLLKWRVIQPLKPMAQLAQTISRETVSASEVRDLERQGLTEIAQRTDELGQLGRVFQKMVREVSDREQQLSAQLQQLRVEIDNTKRINEVQEIAESDYFQKLQQTAKEIRNQYGNPEE
ncbi:sensor protein [Tolypothrix tenuis PCC 7101]|uniref:Sensor protein n=1 Tax=Tolypothrix tenuis PCC 7101 TaxID=231146 RepID=A0A1Z4N0J9_9CYAN|nr:sensor protein [Tolypothrix tenuis PCC 7101]BAZ76830.1 sensor protein [Aulosira laxa NIES-50]